MENVKGLTVIYTGEGKGKTTAALGAATRALGHGMKCAIVQFIKGTMETGETLLAPRLAPELELTRTGLGFTWKKKHSAQEHERAAREGLELARQKASSGEYGLVALDEILYAVKAKLVSADDVAEIIRAKAPHTHLILTGRDAPPELIELADLVTEMKNIKHPMAGGVPAQKGLDF